MRQQDLRNHIEGSFLQKHYLDAFLAQSAYIESLLKTYIDFEFFKTKPAPVKAGKEESPLLDALAKRLERLSLNDVIIFLSDAELISKDQRNQLNKFREKRNRILHDLLKEMRKDVFEEELKKTYLIGKEILESKEVKEIIDLVQYLEDSRASKTSVVEPSVTTAVSA